MLLPTSESNLCAKWQGPYEVIRAIGKVNYEIRQHNRCNELQIYHVHLLKPWQAREALFIAPGKVEDAFGPCIEALNTQSIPMGEQLLPDQQRDLPVNWRVQGCFFLMCPAERTNLVEHAIITSPGITVRERLYRITESLQSGISEEVQAMLELGVIEPYRSEWCSPVVIVAKKDGTNRFCVDFRKETPTHASG